MAAIFNHYNFKLNQPTDTMELDRISNIELGGIDHNDYPDFCDAFIESAEYDGVKLTDSELDELNCNRDFVDQCVLNELFQMNLSDLEHNERLLLKQIALLKEKISIYSKQLRETKKQIKKWKI